MAGSAVIGNVGVAGIKRIQANIKVSNGAGATYRGSGGGSVIENQTLSIA